MPSSPLVPASPADRSHGAPWRRRRPRGPAGGVSRARARPVTPPVISSAGDPSSADAAGGEGDHRSCHRYRCAGLGACRAGKGFVEPWRRSWRSPRVGRARSPPSAPPTSARRRGTRGPAPAQRVSCRHGRPPLAVSATLGAAARTHAEDMRDRDYFDHVNPEGKGPGSRARAQGYPSGFVGENIAAGYPSAAAAMAGWIDSDGHRDNMLYGAYGAVGIGMARGGSWRYYWVQDFGDVADSAPGCDGGTPPPPRRRHLRRRRRRRPRRRRPHLRHLHRGRTGATSRRSGGTAAGTPRPRSASRACKSPPPGQVERSWEQHGAPAGMDGDGDVTAGARLLVGPRPIASACQNGVEQGSACWLPRGGSFRMIRALLPPKWVVLVPRQRNVAGLTECLRMGMPVSIDGPGLIARLAR